MFPPVRVCVKEILLYAYEQLPKREREGGGRKIEAVRETVVEKRCEDWSQQA